MLLLHDFHAFEEKLTVEVECGEARRGQNSSGSACSMELLGEDRTVVAQLVQWNFAIRGGEEERINRGGGGHIVLTRISVHLQI